MFGMNSGNKLEFILQTDLATISIIEQKLPQNK